MKIHKIDFKIKTRAQRSFSYRFLMLKFYSNGIKNFIYLFIYIGDTLYAREKRACLTRCNPIFL